MQSQRTLVLPHKRQAPTAQVFFTIKFFRKLFIITHCTLSHTLTVTYFGNYHYYLIKKLPFLFYSSLTKPAWNEGVFHVSLYVN